MSERCDARASALRVVVRYYLVAVDGFLGFAQFFKQAVAGLAAIGSGHFDDAAPKHVCVHGVGRHAKAQTFDLFSTAAMYKSVYPFSVSWFEVHCCIPF